MARSDFATELRGYIVNPTERRLRSPWRVTIWVVGTLFLTVVFAGLAASVLPPGNGTGLGAALRNLARTTWVWVAALGSGLGVGYLLDRRRLVDFGLELDRQWWRDAAFGLALGVALPTVVLVVELTAGLVTITGVLVTESGGPIGFGGTGAATRLVLLAVFFLVQATTEEVLVRGYLLTNAAEGLAGAFGKWRATVVATVLTGALFGVLHATNPSASLLSVTNITLYGVLLGACYVLTGRLGIAAGFHVAWNYTLGLYGFPVSGIPTGAALLGTETTGLPLVTGGSFGPEGGLVALPLLVVGSGALAWWVRREYGAVAVLEAVATPTLRRTADASDRPENQDG
ncbi:CPBP family intramembrane glutamic endopeptidase [Halomicroarcula sp. GCM10025324]|uniref:CPBP family intramembrane glutamic endopeptidase n=1 Tax=Haloarcula TaxID=2237 RepID=UPI0023E80424|nr:type II CAAX endopeptidase family protein [Halomicroarcula sp. ZS-22-S1]